MSRAIIHWLMAAIVFAGVGAITGMIAAAFLGVVIFQPGISAGLPGMTQAYAALMIAGAALGALGGILLLYRL